MSDSLDETPGILQQAGKCRICAEAVLGSHISTAKYKYHHDCFVCSHCLQPFKDALFFEVRDNFFCSSDYQLLHGSRCGKCCELITGKCISALDTKWHVEHFNCVDCGRSLVGSNFIRKEDKPYCKTCPNAPSADAKKSDSVCMQCNTDIQGDVIVIRGNKYHPAHFTCSTCKKKLDGRAKEIDGELFCYPDYQKMMSQTCASCRRPVQGRSVSALGKIYHPDHFVCTKCEVPFNGSVYQEHEGRPYCPLHHKEIIGAVCHHCWQPSTGNTINALGSKWCELHFMCSCCLDSLAGESTVYVEWDNKPVCKKCFVRLPGNTKRNINKYKDLEVKFAP